MEFLYKHELYSVWQGIRRRCRNPNFKHWPRYGGRGITVCEEWDTFAQFLQDMGERPTPKHTIDRIDNDGPYSPSNCRWATRREQSHNLQKTTRLTIEGREYLAVDLSEISGLKTDTIVNRARKGMTYEQVIAKTRYTFTGGVQKAVEVRVRNQLARTHCRNGHAWTPENTGQQKSGRYCRACHCLKTQRQRAEKRVSQKSVDGMT